MIGVSGFIEFLIDNGFELVAEYEEFKTYILKHHVVRVRIIDEVVCWGAEKSFDRWTNSKDWVSGIPKNEKSAQRRLEKVLYWIERGLYDPAWGAEVMI